MKIKISEISIQPILPTQKGVVAFCNFVINNIFKVCDVAIVSTLDGKYRLCYPIKEIYPHNKKVQVFYPISKKIGDEIQKQVLKKFYKLFKDKYKIKVDDKWVKIGRK